MRDYLTGVQIKQLKHCPRLHIHSREKFSLYEVLIDDYLPCAPGGGPLFSRSNDDSLWVSLVEKAMAKLHGGYVYLKSSMKHRWTHEGLTVEVYGHLTNCSSACEASCTCNCDPDHGVCDSKTGICGSCKTGWYGKYCSKVSDAV